MHCKFACCIESEDVIDNTVKPENLAANIVSRFKIFLAFIFSEFSFSLVT